jgi:endonuclease/exonuclease/phosphatase family metal-dependent hydrolase
MIIATYNLRAGGRRGNRVHWQRLLDDFAPDILLLQETRHPREYLDPGFYQANANHIHWQAAPNRPWGSAVYVRSGDLKPVALPQHSGFVVAAEITGGDWLPQPDHPYYVFSLHVPAPYRRSMSEILDGAAALAGGHNLVLGGDFNLGVSVRHTSEPVPSDPPWLLRRLRREFNLINCWQTVHPNRDLAQTLRWARNPATPYHCDGVFVPAAWYRYLEDCQVISDAGWDALSDHSPVVVTLED